jgi:uncharacterized protein (TIGR04255 family)
MIPDYACERLWNSPIALVVAQVRFPPLSSFQERSKLTAFFDAVSSDYPHYSEDKALGIVLTDKGIRNQEGETSHRFTSSDFLWSVALGSESMGLECRRNGYKDISDFIARFSRISRLLEQLNPKKQLRFGFRFVNEIRVNGADTDYAYWYSKLNPEVLGYNAAESFGGTVDSTISEVNVRRDDGTLRVRRGYLPHGSTVPAMMTPRGPMLPATGAFYLIDIDYFDESVVDFDPDFQARLRGYDALIYRVFHWIVGDGELWSTLRGNQP